MMRYFQMLYWSVRLLRIVPFKIYRNSSIRIFNRLSFKLNGRLVLGPRKDQAVLSQTPINIWVGKSASLSIDHSVSFGPGVSIVAKENAKIEIGHSSYVTSDAHIESVNSIVIGHDCAISWNVTIIDDNHHKVLFQNSLAVEKKGIQIGNKVWIGCHCVLLAGTKLGDNCIVAAGSVVKGEFPAGSLIGGNPAKILKSNVSWH